MALIERLRALVIAFASRPAANSPRARLLDFHLDDVTGNLSVLRKRTIASVPTREWLNLSTVSDFLGVLGVVATPGASQVVDYACTLVRGTAGTPVENGLVELLIPAPATATYTFAIQGGVGTVVYSHGTAGGTYRVVLETNASGLATVRATASTGSGAITVRANVLSPYGIVGQGLDRVAVTIPA